MKTATIIKSSLIAVAVVASIGCSESSEEDIASGDATNNPPIINGTPPQNEEDQSNQEQPDTASLLNGLKDYSAWQMTQRFTSHDCEFSLDDKVYSVEIDTSPSESTAPQIAITDAIADTEAALTVLGIDQDKLTVSGQYSDVVGVFEYSLIEITLNDESEGEYVSFSSVAPFTVYDTDPSSSDAPAVCSGTAEWSGVLITSYDVPSDLDLAPLDNHEMVINLMDQTHSIYAEALSVPDAGLLTIAGSQNFSADKPFVRVHITVQPGYNGPGTYQIGEGVGRDAGVFAASFVSQDGTTSCAMETIAESIVGIGTSGTLTVVAIGDELEGQFSGTVNCYDGMREDGFWIDTFDVTARFKLVPNEGLVVLSTI